MARETQTESYAETTIFAPATPQPRRPAVDPAATAASPRFSAQDVSVPFPRPKAARPTDPRPPERNSDATRRAQPAPVPVPAGVSEDIAHAALEVYRDNPGLAIAVPIFELLVEAQRQPSGDADALQATLLDELQVFEAQAIARGLSHQHTRMVLYALAATADDCVLNTPWGVDSDWASKTLVSALFHETWGGERFYTLLGQMMAAPHSVVREIEFYYFCLQFGFEGKYRLAANGASEFIRVKEDVYQFLRSVRGGVRPELSPNWRGVVAEREGEWASLSFALGGVGIAAFLVLLFVGYSLVLHREGVLAVQNINQLMANPVTFHTPAVLVPAGPTAPVAPPAPVATAAPMPAPAPRAVAQTPFQIVSSALEEEQKSGLLTVFARTGTVVIQTRQELFATASTSLRPPYPQVMKKVAAALAEVAGPIQVVGYTDDVPINTAAYPNNIALSTARAQAVADTLATELGSDARLSALGKGASDPVASNGTAEGRQKNRRVEITLTPK